MTPQEIKQKSIREYLNNLGIHHAKEYSNYGLYYSPYREDNNASFKVDYDRNLWIDYGTDGVAVLNSVANIQKAIDFLKSHKEIYTYLDNDDAGRKATELIQSIHSTVYNRSTNYSEYKDLNDYLYGKKLAVKPEVQKKKSGIKI